MFLEWYRNAITGASRPHFHQERESIVETVEYPVQAKRRFWMDVHPAIQTFWPVPRVLDHMDQLALFLGGWSYHFVFLPGSSQQFRFKPSREPSGMTTFFISVDITIARDMDDKKPATTTFGIQICLVLWPAVLLPHLFCSWNNTFQWRLQAESANCRRPQFLLKNIDMWSSCLWFPTI